MAQIIGRCPHCGNIIHRETEQGLKDKYIGVCHTCDENFYTFEIENFVGVEYVPDWKCASKEETTKYTEK